VSARTGRGLDELWETILEHRRMLEAAGELERRRRHQARSWMWRLVEDGLVAALRADPEASRDVAELEREIEERRRSAPRAARDLLERFLRRGPAGGASHGPR
jgi:LAO/AO transport system kinase